MTCAKIPTTAPPDNWSRRSTILPRGPTEKHTARLGQLHSQSVCKPKSQNQKQTDKRCLRYSKSKDGAEQHSSALPAQCNSCHLI